MKMKFSLYNEVLNKVYLFCLKTSCQFVFVSGNGGSGKTTFAKNLKTIFESNGFKANLISMDDFITNSTVRKKAKVEYIDQEGNDKTGTYTSSFFESYYLNAYKALIYNLKNGISVYHIPHKAKDNSEYIFLNGDATINIVEGVASQFLEKDSGFFSINIDCDVELEAKRRIKRARNGEQNQNIAEVINQCSQRREQLKQLDMFVQHQFDLVLNSTEDYNFEISKDVFNVVGENMNKDCEIAIALIKQARELLSKDFKVYNKGNNGDVVTSLDLKIEKFLVEKSKIAFNGFEIISEEYSPINKVSKNCVIINGIDGTVNVSKGMPIFGMQYAVVRNGVNTASVVYLPFLNELYYCDEESAYLNGEKLVVDSSVNVEDGLISATGTKRVDDFINMKKYGKLFRDYGSIAVSFVWVASGKINLAIYRGNKVWNYYPVLKICEKAGAKIISKQGLYCSASNNKFLSIINQ